MESRLYTLWVTIRRADDIADEWVAHVLDLDLVTQGTTVKHALLMAREAAELVIVDDLNEGRDPLSRGGTAPEDSWSMLWAIQDRGCKLDSIRDLGAALATDEGVGVGVAQFMVGVERRVPDVEDSKVAWFDRTAGRPSQLECV